MAIPNVPESGILPLDWTLSPIDGLKVSIGAVDEFSMVSERRGFSAPVPKDPADYPEFLKSVADVVTKTIAYMLEARLKDAK